MKNISFLIYSLYFFSQFSFGNDYKSFSDNLSNLKRECRAFVQNEKEVDILENEIHDLEWQLNKLENDLIEFIKAQELNNNDEFKSLLIEINEFKSFTFGTCECLYYFNKFLGELGAKTFFIKQQEEIRVYVAVVGNFKFYYAYSLNNWLQDVTINTIMSNGHETFGFGLYEEVEIFRITSKNENIKPFYIKVKVLKKEKKIKYNECEDTFPRL